MGYYTRFKLAVIVGNNDVIQEFRDENENADCAIEGEDCKWYSHEEDLKKFSTKHPEVLFKLSGTGEEAGDMWVKYVKNGKMQVCRAKIIYDDYNPFNLT